MKHLLLTAVATATLLLASAAQAGPFILAGTDSEDHGSASGGANQAGWLYMQKALENISGGVTTGIKKVTILGSTSTALTAASSAFNLSSALTGAGWTLDVISLANFGTFFGAGGNLGTGILMMDSGDNVVGGVDDSNYTAYATKIDDFLAAGGGLFSQANGYSWLATLIPTITFTDIGIGGSASALAMTPAGTAAFPGLTNADLSAGPWHGYFSNIGALTDLADAPGVINNVIIGGRTGSITTQVPEPGSLALVGLALATAGLAAKRKRA